MYFRIKVWFFRGGEEGRTFKKDNIVLLLYYVESLTGSTVPFHN